MEQAFNIANLFFASAQKYPGKIAIIDKDKSITFSALEKKINETAAYFASKNIVKDDRILLFVPMSIDLYRIVIALFKIGATAVFLDEWVSRERMDECCKVAQCKAFIGILKVRVFALFSKELRKIPAKLGVGYSIIKEPITYTEVNSNDIALITFTTGTTGIPKAANRSHGFLYQQLNALIEKIEPHPADIDMPVLPIVLLINLAVGCTSVITSFKASKPNLLNVRKVIKQVEKYNVNRLVASPFFVKRLAEYIIANKIKTASLKKIFTGGAPVFPMEAELYHTAFPQAQVQIVYGSTEAEPISSINIKELIAEKEYLLKKGLNVGLPYRKIEVKIIAITSAAIRCSTDEALEQISISAGNIGEIIVSGPHVLRDYLNNEEALKRNKIFINNKCWHRTGDSGYMDENGLLYLTGRCSTLFYINEKIIAPFIYENYFQTISGVTTGTVMQSNNKVIAIIETEKNIEPKHIVDEIKQAGISIDEIKFISKMPKDQRHNSRIDYERLRKIITP